jgi:hypothetical protein
MTERSRLYRPIVLALGAITLFVAPLRAQDTTLAAPAPAPAAAPATQNSQVTPTSSGPTLEGASVGVRNAESKAAAPASPAGRYYDQGTKLMIIGGAAILTGIVVGGNAGHAISIVGAVIGLYGLYKYLE